MNDENYWKFRIKLLEDYERAVHDKDPTFRWASLYEEYVRHLLDKMLEGKV